MDGNKKVSIAGVIVNYICVILWIINLILDFTDGYANSRQLFFHIICVICWSVIATTCTLRYIKFKNNNK